MVLDSSAILAVIFAEQGHQSVLRRMGEARFLAVGAPTLVETALVLSSRLRQDATALLTRISILALARSQYTPALPRRPRLFVLNPAHHLRR